MKLALSIVAALAMGAPAVTLTGDKAMVITGQNIQAELRQMDTEAQSAGMSTHYLATYKNVTTMLSLRTSTGQSEVHQHVDDVMVVQQGSAKLTTGGTLIDGKPVDNSGNGEIRGSGIQGGESRMIEVGDVVIVPAGVPHFIQIPPGTVYSAFVTKIKEQ